MRPPDFLVRGWASQESLAQIAQLEQGMTALQNEKK
jgi:hypothetical protein